MRDVLEAVAIVLLVLVILGALALVIFRDLRRLYTLVTGKVPMYKIVRFALVMIIGLAVLYPVLRHLEKSSPLHLVVKPEAEARVRHSVEVKQLIGDRLSFGSEGSFSYSDQGQTGTGDFTMPVKGSIGNGDVEVTAMKSDGVWRVESIVLVAKDKRVPIPPN